MMRILLDTDIVLYRSATTAEKEWDWGDDIWSLYTDLGDAKAAFKTQVDTICNKLQCKDVLFCLTDHSHNFRRDVDPSYKSNRKGTRKPVGYVALVDWVKDNFPTMSKKSTEADDVMGILATRPENKGKCIIVSDDKDLKSIASKLYRPTSGELLDITEEQADAFFYAQTLIGDRVDGYPGCPGVGEKTAAKILGQRPSWSAVEQAYIKAGLTVDDAIKQARLARILRWTDYDHENGKVKLWTPTR